MGELSVCFRGICANFRGVVPGAPHRVVLPNAAAVRFGVCEVPGLPAEDWIVMPHLAFMYVENQGVQQQLNVPGAMRHGWISRPVQLQILNAKTESGLSYAPSYDTIPSLREYVNHYQYSPDIVLGGRGICQFDLISGDLSMKLHGEAMQMVANVATDGDPVIRVTPLSIVDGTVRSTDLTLPSVTSLLVGNLSLECGNPDAGSYDFLLHFLTATSGIPADLKALPPGWPKEDQEVQETDPVPCLTELLSTGYPHPERFDVLGTLPRIVDVGVRISCSDSRYP